MESLYCTPRVGSFWTQADLTETSGVALGAAGVEGEPSPTALLTQTDRSSLASCFFSWTSLNCDDSTLLLQINATFKCKNSMRQLQDLCLMQMPWPFYIDNDAVH